MPSLYTEIEIEAPLPMVWEVLYHKEDWNRWNTFLYDCDPSKPFVQGRSVDLSLRRVEGEEETEFQPVVTLVQPPVCLRWVAQVPGLRSEHTFDLQSLGQRRTKYMHREQLSGWLAGFFLPFIRQEEKQGLKRMARQLKRFAEYQYFYAARRR